MKYRVFIASTRLEFEKHREHIIDRLRKANIDVIGMEDWTADPDHPAVLSAKNIAGCHICIAIIGFHRGSTVKHDSKGRSYTQIEIDTARSCRVRILPFVLRDTENNRMSWPTSFNCLADAGVQKWRREFESGITSEFFDANEMLDVLPAVIRQICKWEQLKRSILQGILALIAIVCLTIAVIFSTYPRGREWLLSRVHAYHDPIVFQHSRDGKYNVARLFQSRSDIQDNSNLREEIASSQDSFVMFANTMGSFRQYESDFLDAAKRGIKLRFVVTDFSEANRQNWESFQNATENSPENIVETRAVAANTRKFVRELKRQYPNSIDYRLNNRPILYTLWVRDASLSNGIGHLGVHFYGKTSQAYWPAIRVSPRTGGNQFLALTDQFETIWAQSVPDEEDR